jgi:hypothetical protein
MDLISTYLSTNPTFNPDALIKYIYSQIPHKLYHHRLHYKKYPEHNLVQIFTESSQEFSDNELFNACRSIIFDSVNNKIVSFSHPNIEYITELNDNLENTSFTESHEGTLISVFYHNNKWFYATRREIDMYKTHKITKDSKSVLSHGLMFEDALAMLSMTKEQFESKLNPEYQYYIELVHYQNAFNISYESRFGEKYGELFLLFARKDLVLEDVSIPGILNNPKLDYATVKDKLNDVNANVEGYIYLSLDNNHMCKVVHNTYYEKMKYNPGLRTIQEQYIYMYQKDMLNEYCIKNNCVVYKTTEMDNKIESVGLMSCIFTYISQRLLDIYYKFNTNMMVHKDEELFKKLFQNSGSKKYYLIFHILGMMKGIHKNRQINIVEMKKLLKFKLVASDIWKVFNELMVFEETENLLSPWTNPLVKMF